MNFVYPHPSPYAEAAKQLREAIAMAAIRDAVENLVASTHSFADTPRPPIWSAMATRRTSATTSPPSSMKARASWTQRSAHASARRTAHERG